MLDTDPDRDRIIAAVQGAPWRPSPWPRSSGAAGVQIADESRQLAAHLLVVAFTERRWS